MVVAICLLNSFFMVMTWAIEKKKKRPCDLYLGLYRVMIMISTNIIFVISWANNYDKDSNVNTSVFKIKYD